ncbi:MAG: hypothetical protein GTN64_04770, partial [Candidatus Latescibacteria bacterium]|nr:hypothetical protein [Candidatus Latescibacterota bacterium]NIO77921.1 hypothetical protein [Candidatus Latescibacterota bacterium]
VLREFRFNEAMKGEGDLFAGVQRIVHQHRVAHVDEQHGLAVGGKLLAMDRKVVGFDS